MTQASVIPEISNAVPELLAPAGDFEAMRAAVANGADAVYFGLGNFNARHRATNFTIEELPRTMAYLHAHNVRGYVTFNTLIFSNELSEAVSFIQAIAAAGADAVIVQDLGIARLIHRLCPGLPIHGSTQMTLTEPMGIEFVRRLGVERVILARELSADDVRKIASATTVPVEVFIHGALCISYSGQCLTSEALGGRSANRGQCAQACRLPYDLIVDGQRRDLGDKAYLLSPQDLAAHDLIGELAEIGVRSFKIEGRLKSAQYVAATTQTYRSALDAALSNRPFAPTKDQELDLGLSFSRGFSSGFLKGVNHQQLVHARFPKSRGIRVGSVFERRGEMLLIRIENPKAELKIGDGIVFDEGHPEQDEQGGRIVSVTPNTKSGTVLIGFRTGDVNLSAVATGAIVWKTDDPAIRKRLEHSYSRQRVVHRRKLHAVISARAGRPLRIDVRDESGHHAIVTWDGPLQLAQKHPLSESLLRDQFGRLGDTPFELSSVDLTDADAVMVPKSVLNDLRRQAVESLLNQRSVESRYDITDSDALNSLRAAALVGHPKMAVGNSLSVLVRTLDQLDAALAFAPSSATSVAMVYCDFEDIRKHKEAVARARAAGLSVALATTRIIKPGEEGLLNQLLQCRPDAVLVRNFAAIAFFQKHDPQLPLIGDYSLNIANELTAAIFAEQNLVRLVPSYDLNWKQLTAMLKRFPADRFEAVIHQHIPMFHMEHCVFAHTLSNGKDYRDCGRPCDRHSVDLRDRVDAAHPLIADVGCRNTVYNAHAQSAAEFIPEMQRLGIRHYRVELLRETRESATALLMRYARALAGLEAPQTTWRQLKVLNQLGVTRGTLDD